MIRIHLVQSAMAEAGHYTGQIDGSFGPLSRAARDAILRPFGGERWPHSRAMMAIWQWTLARYGFYAGAIDGISGPATRAAEYEFQRPKGEPLPWMVEAEKLIGLHEVADHDELAAWLKSDNRSSGDPARVPWCGDFVSTCIARALPKERQPANPFAARNWEDWGSDATGLYGAVIVFWRGKRHGWQGHVGFATGMDQDRGLVQVLGGNQQNEVSRAWLGLDRVLAWRAPKAFLDKMAPVAILSAGAATASQNEA